MKILFCRPLEGYTRGKDIYKKVNEFFEKEGLNRKNCVGVCTDGAAAMTGQDHNIKPYFPHPVTREPDYVILDPCHMLKLVRNCLKGYKILINSAGNTISWDFIVRLAHLQDDNGLRTGNKLKSRHIHYDKMKMKVSLAVQTLSSSVADAIEYCNVNSQMPEFAGRAVSDL